MRPIHLEPVLLPNGTAPPLCPRCRWQLTQNNELARDLHQRLLAEPPAGDKS
jgi:hypothetical protein